MSIGMTEIARRVGVSQKTVSRVVNNEPHVSEEIRRKVQRAIDESGYRPNHAARSLVTRRHRRIGMVSTGASQYGPSSLIAGVQAAAGRRGYYVTVARTLDETVPAFRGAVEEVLAQGVDALLTSESVDIGHPDIRLPPGMPIATFDPPEGGSRVGEFVIAADESGGTRAATEHLLDLGHEMVHHVAGPADWSATRRRIQGWQAALAARGIAAPPPAHGDWSPGSGMAAMQRLLQTGEVTAVVVANDQMAIGAIHAVETLGLAVPGDISVVGFDDAPESAYLSTPLTTVRQDFAATTSRAVATLLDAIEDEADGPAEQILPVHLVVRSSTAVPRTPRS